MKKSELRQIIKEEIQRLDETAITTIKNFNLESDVAIASIDYFKNSSKFRKIVIPNGIDYYEGGNVKSVYTVIANQLMKSGIINANSLAKIGSAVKSKKFDEVIGVNSEKTVANLVSKIMSQAIMFELSQNPNTFPKQFNDKKFSQAGSAHSVKRGKGKVSNMAKGMK